MRATPSTLWMYWSVMLLCLSSSLTPAIMSSALASPKATLVLSPEQVTSWLNAQRGVQRFTVDVPGTLKGESVIEVRSDARHIDLYDSADVFSHGRRASDQHRVSHKRFQAHPPYALLSAEWYELKEGEARVGAWRATDIGQSRGEWREAPAQVIRRSERRGEHEGVTLAGALWRSALPGRPLEVPETLISHVGPHLLTLGQSIEVSELNWGALQRYTLSVLDQRLNRPHAQGSKWVELLEVKVIASSGQVSRLLRSTQGRLLSASASDQVSLTATPPLISDLRSMSALLRARGSLSEQELQRAMSPAREGFSACSKRYNKQRSTFTTRTLRLHLDAKGELTSVGFYNAEGWGELERCLAHEVTRLHFPTPQGGEALIKYPLRFQPSR